MLSTVRTYASFVKFSHTVFALPFAIAGMVAAYAVPVEKAHLFWTVSNGESEIGGYAYHNVLPFEWLTVGLILICMVGARSFAMAVNRIFDWKIDALNPRTAQREIPSGKLSLQVAWLFAASAAIVYFGACTMLGNVVLVLSPIPIALMTFYPLTKRFTAACHLILGASLALAPVGAWVAVRSNFVEPASPDILAPVAHPAAVLELAPWLLGCAVMFWVAGFDVIYALQDDQFDRENRLHSLPARIGRSRALWASRLMHVVSAALFFAFIGYLLFIDPKKYPMDVIRNTQLASWVWAAPCVMVVGMIYQHSLVKPDDLSRVNVAFFTVNGVISVIFGSIFVAAWLLA